MKKILIIFNLILITGIITCSKENNKTIKNTNGANSMKKLKTYYVDKNEKVINKKNKYGGPTLEVKASKEQKEKYNIQKLHYLLDYAEGNPYEIITFYIPQYTQKTGIFKAITISDFRSKSETIEYNSKNQIIKKEIFSNDFMGNPDSIKLLKTEIYEKGKSIKIITNKKSSSKK